MASPNIWKKRAYRNIQAFFKHNYLKIILKVGGCSDFVNLEKKHSLKNIIK